MKKTCHVNTLEAEYWCPSCPMSTTQKWIISIFAYFSRHTYSGSPSWGPQPTACKMQFIFCKIFSLTSSGPDENESSAPNQWTGVQWPFVVGFFSEVFLRVWFLAAANFTGVYAPALENLHFLVRWLHTIAIQLLSIFTWTFGTHGFLRQRIRVCTRPNVKMCKSENMHWLPHSSPSLPPALTWTPVSASGWLEVEVEVDV